jgi:hypothetical protein
MIVLGDRYDVPGLRDVTVKKYSSRAAVPGVPLELLESIYDVYKGTPASIRQLRDTAGVLVRKNYQRCSMKQLSQPPTKKSLPKCPSLRRNC